MMDGGMLSSTTLVTSNTHHQLCKLFLRLICVASVTVVGLVAAGSTQAQNCETIPGPTRTDCLIGRARTLGVKYCGRKGTTARRRGATPRHDQHKHSAEIADS
jgi:hypothetical protein